MKTLTIPVTPEKFAEIKAVMQQNKEAKLSGDDKAGVIEGRGVKASYIYDGSTLRIDILKHPFLVTSEYCAKKIAEAIAEV